jgi:hypothetical protein
MTEMSAFNRQVNEKGDTLADLIADNLAEIVTQLGDLNRNLYALMMIIKKKEAR